MKRPIERHFREHAISWSRRRDRLMAFCPRAYFYYYYGAAGGFDEHAPEPARTLDYLKKYTCADRYLDRTFARVLHLCHYDPVADQSLTDQLIFRFKLDCTRMFSGESADDHGTLHFFELEQQHQSAPPFLDRLQNQLLERGQIAVKNHLAPAPEQAQLILFRSPIELHWMELPIFFAPVSIWRQDGVIHFLEHAKASDPVTAVIHKRYAADHLNGEPQKVVTHFYNSGTGVSSVIADADLPIGQSMNEIRSSFNRMTQYIRPDGSVREQDFEHRRGENCNQCFFSSYCKS